MLRTVASRHDVEDDLGTNRLADPVALHDLDALGPVYSIKVVGQTIGVVGYPEEPLFQLLLLHRSLTAPALAILCLLVGQDTLTAGAPPPVSYTHLRAHETRHDLVCRLLLEKKKKKTSGKKI